MSTREPFLVRCEVCDHVWVAAWLPLRLDAMGKLLKGLCCPDCGQDASRIFQAPAGATPSGPPPRDDEE